MSRFVSTIRDQLEKRARYNRIVAEIRGMSRETSWDIGIFPEDAAQIAARAVYGR